MIKIGYDAGSGDFTLAMVAALLRPDGGGSLADLHTGHPGATRRHVVPLRPGMLSLSKNVVDKITKL